MILVNIFQKISPAAGRNTEIDDLHFEIGTWKKPSKTQKSSKNLKKTFFFTKKYENNLLKQEKKPWKPSKKSKTLHMGYPPEFPFKWKP